VLEDNDMKLLKVENLVALCQHLKNYCMRVGGGTLDAKPAPPLQIFPNIILSLFNVIIVGIQLPPPPPNLQRYLRL